MLMQNFGVRNKEHYGMLWYFLEWSICNEPGDQERRALGTRIAVVWISTKNKWNAQNAI